MRVVAIDPGERRIGIAKSDEEARVALPHSTVQREKNGLDKAAKEVAAVVHELGAELAIVGLPLSLNGQERMAARRARKFGEALRAHLECPMQYEDERFTSSIAEHGLRELGVKGRERRQVVDQAAAQVLLQGFLDRRAGA